MNITADSSCILVRHRAGGIAVKLAVYTRAKLPLRLARLILMLCIAAKKSMARLQNAG
ncbi:hypothetical protein [Tabrizicola sp.]|uniref:hypothetical protein n=1 Tax=Tabrizicola sp. TaxID=2005166 RepID=UPI003F67D218